MSRDEHPLQRIGTADTPGQMPAAGQRGNTATAVDMYLILRYLMTCIRSHLCKRRKDIKSIENLVLQPPTRLRNNIASRFVRKKTGYFFVGTSKTIDKPD